MMNEQERHAIIGVLIVLIIVVGTWYIVKNESVSKLDNLDEPIQIWGR